MNMLIIIRFIILIDLRIYYHSNGNIISMLSLGNLSFVCFGFLLVDGYEGNFGIIILIDVLTLFIIINFILD